MLRVSVMSPDEFLAKHGDKKMSDYEVREIPGVCSVYYNPANGNLIIVRENEEE